MPDDAHERGVIGRGCRENPVGEVLTTLGDLGEEVVGANQHFPPFFIPFTPLFARDAVSGFSVALA